MAVGDHIRNPFELAIEHLSSALGDAATRRRAEPSQVAPAVRRIGVRDLWDALVEGMGDLAAARDDVLFAALIYPLAGLVLARLAFSYNLLPLVFPLAAGFALIGPLAAIGLYEVSRRREEGLPVSWADALRVFRSPALGSILWLGFVLMALFGAWLATAWGLYLVTIGAQHMTPIGPAAPASFVAFVLEVFTTAPGWAMISSGVVIGFVFAALALAISVTSFPLMLDRNVSMPAAVAASLRAVAANPGPMALWGLIVAGSLVLGSIPALFGLIFVVPLLGHATWRLYRKVVVLERQPAPRLLSAQGSRFAVLEAAPLEGVLGQGLDGLDRLGPPPRR